MSVSDPLIKDLKGCILGFIKEEKRTGFITDFNSELLLFCSTIDKILNAGLHLIYNSLGFTKRNDPWLWLEKISTDKTLPFSYVNSVDVVRRCRSTQNNVGRLRLLIRLCLINRCLHVPVEYILHGKKINLFYYEDSIIGDEILCEILLSVLRQSARIYFKLNPENSSFLDLSWIMPEVLKVEFVPCETLGMTVSFSANKAVIMNIKSNSVASENGKIEIGDILETLNGILITTSMKGRLRQIFKSAKGRPVTLTIIKAVYTDLKQVYGPMISLLKDVRFDPEILRTRIATAGNSEDMNTRKRYKGNGLQVTYMGCVTVGSKGDVKQIDKAVSNVFSPSEQNDPNLRYQKCRKDVCFELGEMGVKCVDLSKSEVILNHSYMEISSCGSVASLPNYFAYIAGDDYCNTAKVFTCYIFFARSDEMVLTILQSIGQGFHRTHFAV